MTRSSNNCHSTAVSPPPPPTIYLPQPSHLWDGRSIPTTVSRGSLGDTPVLEAYFRTLSPAAAHALPCPRRLHERDLYLSRGVLQLHLHADLEALGHLGSRRRGTGKQQNVRECLCMCACMQKKNILHPPSVSAGVLHENDR